MCPCASLSSTGVISCQMRHQRRLIERISKVLSKEASARENGRIPRNYFHLIQRETGLSIRIIRYPAWTILGVGLKRGRSLESKLWITVYFGAAPAAETP